MNRILVPTDFSERSDRALRRAVLLARRSGAAIRLVHVVDNDQPEPLVDAACRTATALLDDIARTLREIDGLECSAQVVTGDPFEGIARTAEATAADLVVIGPHRRQLLRDVFVGTTAERTIRTSLRPILMANAIPASPYREVLVAVDLSEQSGDAVRAVAGLGFAEQAAVTILHVFDAPGAGPVGGAGLSRGQIQDYLAVEERRAAAELAAFLRSLGEVTGSRLLRPGATGTAQVIGETAREIAADLVVVGTQGRSGAARLFLGSVAEEVLRSADRDVLAVPRSAGANTPIE